MTFTRKYVSLLQRCRVRVKARVGGYTRPNHGVEGCFAAATKRFQVSILSEVQGYSRLCEVPNTEVVPYRSFLALRAAAVYHFEKGYQLDTQWTPPLSRLDRAMHGWQQNVR